MALVARKLTSHRRKLAFFVSYIGDRYRGYQLQPPPASPDDYVEGRILTAFQSMLPKVNIVGTSSRTDRGVHSGGGVVVCAKCTISPDSDLIALTDNINTRLPHDIRIAHLRLTPRSFKPRRRCRSRRYVYYIPLYALMHNFRRTTLTDMTSAAMRDVVPEQRDALMDEHIQSIIVDMSRAANASTYASAYQQIDLNRLNGICARFVGVFNFHNYSARFNHRLRRVQEELDSQRIARLARQDKRADVAPSDDTIENETDVDDSEDDEADNIDTTEDVRTEHQFDVVLEPGAVESVGEFRLREVASARFKAAFLFRDITLFHCETAIVNGRSFVVATVEANGFLYHQVRKMIAQIVSEYVGESTAEMTEVTLTSPCVIPVPLVPSGGLYCAFTPTAFDQPQYDYRQSATNFLKLNDTEIQQLQAFIQSTLVPHIADATHTDRHTSEWAYCRARMLLTRKQLLDDNEEMSALRTAQAEWNRLRAEKQQRRVEFDLHKNAMTTDIPTKKTVRISQNRQS